MTEINLHYYVFGAPQFHAPGAYFMRSATAQQVPPYPLALGAPLFPL